MDYKPYSLPAHWAALHRDAYRHDPRTPRSVQYAAERCMEFLTGMDWYPSDPDQQANAIGWASR